MNQDILGMFRRGGGKGGGKGGGRGKARMTEQFNHPCFAKKNVCRIGFRGLLDG